MITIFKSLNWRYHLLLCLFIILNGCANNSHVRTQRILNKGDIIFSGSAALPMPIPFVDSGPEVGSISSRVEGSLSLGLGWAEIGVFGALVPIPDVMTIVPIGQEVRGYLGKKFKVEIFRETHSAREDFHQSMIGRITTVTDQFVNNYYGIHFIHAFKKEEEWSFNNGRFWDTKTLQGFGYTQGFEKDNSQIQGDLSYIFGEDRTGYDTGIIFRLSGGYKFLLPAKIFKDKLGPSPLPEKKNISSPIVNEEKLVYHVINHVEVTDTLNGNAVEDDINTNKNDNGSGDLFVLVGGDEILGMMINEDDHSITIASPQLGTIQINKDIIISRPIMGELERISTFDGTESSNDPEMKAEKAKPDEIQNDRQLRLLVDQRMKELDDLPNHKLLMNSGLIPSYISLFIGSALSDRSDGDYFEFPYGIITFPIPIHLTLKTLSKLPDNMSYPDGIRTDEGKKLYRSLLIKKIKRKYLISSFFSIGAFAILNNHFEMFK